METGSLIIALLFLGVGIIAGVLAALILSGGGRKEAAAEDNRMEAYQSEANLRRDRKSGRLVVEMDGQVISSPQAMNGEQRQKAEKLAAELARWLGLQQAAAPQPAAPVTPPPGPAVPGANPAAKRPAGGSIVQQIDEVLQEVLAGTPLAERSIHLSDGPQQSVIVWIGAQRFEGINAVPDPQVKAAIRAAVAEWERRGTKNSPSGQ